MIKSKKTGKWKARAGKIWRKFALVEGEGEIWRRAFWSDEPAPKKQERYLDLFSTQIVLVVLLVLIPQV